MSRGIGEFGPIQDVIPEWAAVLVALVTQLGDVWFLSLLVGAIYWFDSANREDAAVIMGWTFAGLALISTLKHVFALPRPGQPLVRIETLPWVIQPLYESTAMASGYGFPSGHALMTTIVYLSLARRLSISTRRRRFVGAALLVAAVCVSRVVLGVHYLVDVTAGVAVGVAFLAVAERLLTRFSTDHGTVAFGLAIAISAINLIVGGIDADDISLLGASLGALGGWQLVVLGQRLFAVDRPSKAVRPLLRRGVLAAGALIPLLIAVDEFHLFSRPARGGAFGLVLALFVTIPVLRHSDRATRVWTALVFWATMAIHGLRVLLSPSTWRRATTLGRRYTVRVHRWIRMRLG
ncbi:phosphatase PAP2 family protein [Natrinema zhouii]|uniref:Phosphatase PAP2 family protein n=1 Tax=Natrinema zhouii TaxID=1710539 RepID=A0A7D6CNQ3_9EURY|nr:phosphatase PAP2 family protein [Natrinema zhouii]QLK25316.1 phosphatase PAP2 family protein [Natrinema zhouii]